MLDEEIKKDPDTAKGIYLARYKNTVNKLKNQIEDYTKRENLKPEYVVRGDNWDWAFGEKEKKERRENTAPKINTKIPLSHIVRTGGYKIPNIAVESITKQFCFNNVVFGNSLTDTESKEHVRHFLGALSDLAEILDIDVCAINQLGKLDINFGALGVAGHMATYFPTYKAINLTKKRGDGSVAHELFHYIDNVIQEGDVRKSSPHLASEFCVISDKGTKLAIYKLVNYIKNGDGTPKNIVVRFDAQDKVKYHAYSDNLEGAISEIQRLYKIYSYDYENSSVAKYYGFLAHKFGKEYIDVPMKINGTMYYYNSSKIGTKYWVEPAELCARAFEAYIDYILDLKDRKNNYLVSYKNNWTSFGDKMPYPQGEELEKIVLLFDNIFKEMKKEYNLGGFVPFTTERDSEYIEFEPEVKKEKVITKTTDYSEPKETEVKQTENDNINNEDMSVTMIRYPKTEVKEEKETSLTELLESEGIKRVDEIKETKPNLYHVGDVVTVYSPEMNVYLFDAEIKSARLDTDTNTWYYEIPKYGTALVPELYITKGTQSEFIENVVDKLEENEEAVLKRMLISSGGQVRESEKNQREYILLWDEYFNDEQNAELLHIIKNWAVQDFIIDKLESENLHNLHNYIQLRYGNIETSQNVVTSYVKMKMFGHENGMLNPSYFGYDVPDKWEHIVDESHYSDCLKPFTEKTGKQYLKKGDKIVIENSLLTVDYITPEVIVLNKITGGNVSYTFDILSMLFNEDLVKYEGYSKDDSFLFKTMLSEIKWCSIDSLKNIRNKVTEDFALSLKKEHDLLAKIHKENVFEIERLKKIEEEHENALIENDILKNKSKFHELSYLEELNENGGVLSRRQSDVLGLSDFLKNLFISIVEFDNIRYNELIKGIGDSRIVRYWESLSKFMGLFEGNISLSVYYENKPFAEFEDAVRAKILELFSYDEENDLIMPIVKEKEIEVEPTISEVEVLKTEIKGMDVLIKYADKKEKAILEKELKGLKILLKMAENE